MDRIFKLFQCQRPTSLLIGIEDGSIDLLSPEGIAPLTLYCSTWECIQALSLLNEQGVVRNAFIAKFSLIRRWCQVMIDTAFLQPAGRRGLALATRIELCLSIVSILFAMLNDLSLRSMIRGDMQMIGIITKL